MYLHPGKYIVLIASQVPSNNNGAHFIIQGVDSVCPLCYRASNLYNLGGEGIWKHFSEC